MTCAPTAAFSCDYAPCWPFCLYTLLLLCIFLFSVLSPLPLFPGQISLAPWGQMRRPSWLMCRVTTTRSQASRRWELKWKRKKPQNKTITGNLPKWLAANHRSAAVVFANINFLAAYMGWLYNTVWHQKLQYQAKHYRKPFFIKVSKMLFVWNELFWFISNSICAMTYTNLNTV